jgi:chondroitin 4-sulfotransferase 11
MLCNARYNFAFVHIQKTAGKSVSEALFKIPGTFRFGNAHNFVKDVDTYPYYKFAFVRNPWDRMVSWYNMITITGKTNSFHSYILENSDNFSEFLKCKDEVIEKIDVQDASSLYFKSISYNQLDYLSDKTGNLRVDFIGRFENLQTDFNKILEKLNWSGIELGHLNRLPHQDYRFYYQTANDIEAVYNIFQRDINYFGYTF